MNPPFRYWSGRVDRPGSAVLPGNATGLEKAMADVSAEELLAINAEAIAGFWDPDAVTECNMPHLAAALGVNFWDDSWSVPAKRRWLRLQQRFQSVRGTRAALDMIADQLRYAGAPVRIKRVRSGKGRFFLSGPNPARDAKWKASLPEIRIYTERPRSAPRNVMSFPTPGKLSPRMFLAGPDSPYIGFAAGRGTEIGDVHIRRAVMIEDGVETPVGLASNTPAPVEQVYIRERSRAFRGGVQYLNHTFLNGDPAKPLITIDRSGMEGWNLVAQGGTSKASPESFPVVERANTLAFVGKPLGRFLTRADKATAYYESFRVTGRGELAPTTGGVVAFLNHTRMGNRARTIEVDLEFPRTRRRPIRVFLGRPFSGRFLSGGTDSDIDDVKRAIKAASAKGDRVLLNFDTRPTFGQARSFNEIV
jgi:phage tail P2-like protein